MLKKIFWKKEIKLKEEWFFFKEQKDWKEALVRTNLFFKKNAPIKWYKNMIFISIYFKKPLKNWFTTSEEFKKICEIENVLFEILEKKCNTLFVSAVKFDWRLNLYFYNEDWENIEQVINETMLQFDDYKYFFDIKEDKKWKDYFAIFDGNF